MGVGPGRFRETSPTALSDRDAVWAHNEYLELGGSPGGIAPQVDGRICNSGRPDLPCRAVASDG